MNPVHVVMRGASDWKALRSGVTCLFRGLVLLALGILLGIWAYYEYATHWSLHGGARPGSEILGACAAVSGIVTWIGGPLLMLVGVYLLAGIPAASGRGRWDSWGAVCVPPCLLLILAIGWAIRQIPARAEQATVNQVQPALPPDASLWDSVVGPSGGQAQPAPEAPPLRKPRQIWGMDLDDVLFFAAVIGVAGVMFFWTLCIIRLLRAAARNFGDRALSRWFAIFFIASWSIIADWGFCYFDSTVLERIANSWLPGHTENEMLFTSAPAILLGLIGWQMVLLRKLTRDLKRPPMDPVPEGGLA